MASGLQSSEFDQPETAAIRRIVQIEVSGAVAKAASLGVATNLGPGKGGLPGGSRPIGVDGSSAQGNRGRLSIIQNELQDFTAKFQDLTKRDDARRVERRINRLNFLSAGFGTKLAQEERLTARAIKELGARGISPGAAIDIQRRARLRELVSGRAFRGAAVGVAAAAATRLQALTGPIRGILGPGAIGRFTTSLGARIGGAGGLAIAAGGGVLGIVFKTTEIVAAATVLASFAKERARFEAFRRDRGLDAFTEASSGFTSIKIPGTGLTVGLAGSTAWDEVKSFSLAVATSTGRAIRDFSLNPFKDIAHETQRNRSVLTDEKLLENINTMRNRFSRELARDGDAIGGWKKQGLSGS